MIGQRQLFYFRAISGILIFFFLVQMKGLPVTGEELGEQFQMAKNEYIDKIYNDAKVRLERLASVYETIKEQTDETNEKYRQVILLLGACYERTGNSFKAEYYYREGLKDSQGNILILEPEKNSLPIYKKVSEAIIKEKNHKKKK